MLPGRSRDVVLREVSRNLRYADRDRAVEAAAAMSEDDELIDYDAIWHDRRSTIDDRRSRRAVYRPGPTAYSKNRSTPPIPSLRTLFRAPKTLDFAPWRRPAKCDAPLRKFRSDAVAGKNPRKTGWIRVAGSASRSDMEFAARWIGVSGDGDQLWLLRRWAMIWPSFALAGGQQKALISVRERK